MTKHFVHINKQLDIIFNACFVMFLYTISIFIHEAFNIIYHKKMYYDIFLIVRILFQFILICIGVNVILNHINTLSICSSILTKRKIIFLFLFMFVVLTFQHIYNYYYSYILFNPQNCYLTKSSCLHYHDSQCRVTNCNYVDKKNPKILYIVSASGSVCPYNKHFINSDKLLIKNKYMYETRVLFFKIFILLFILFFLIL